MLQCNRDLMTLNLVTTCDLVTIFQRPFFNSLHKIIRFSDIMPFSDSFCGDQVSLNRDCMLYFFGQERLLKFSYFLIDELIF